MNRCPVVITCLISILLFLAFNSVALGAVNAVTGINSSSHTKNVSSTDNTIDLSWSRPTTDDPGGIVGYSVVFTSVTDTVPEASKTPEAAYSQFVETTSTNPSTTSAALPDGTWYFHIRAVDESSAWSAESHDGPYIIDTSPAPTVTKIEPATGVNSSETITVTITGTNFMKLDGSSFTSVSARIGNTSLSPVSVSSATSISATYAIQNKTAGAYDVTVTTDWGTSSPLEGGFAVTNPAPTITSISPTSASNGAEKTVTITGTGFLSAATTPAGTASPTIQMRDPDNTDRNFDLTSVTVVSTTSVTGVVAAGKTAGTYDVVVTNSDNQSATGADAFQVTLPAPTITSVSPSSGTNDSTISITIVGTNFVTTGTTLVTLEASGKDTISATNISVTSSTEITASIPADKASGQYDMKVTNPDSQFASKTTAFTLNNPAPTVSAISPTSASSAAEKSVTITGTGFLSTSTTPPATGNPTVSMRDPDNTSRNFDLTNVTVASKTSITATVPSGKTAGTYDVVVTNADSQSGAKADAFEVTAPAPTITSVSPSSGTNDQATSITITGTNYQTSGTTLVTLEATGKDTISATSVSVSSATEISASVPVGEAIGTYSVKVTNPDSQFASKSDAFSVTNPVATVTSITPASMTNDASQFVTIAGTNFRTGTTVKIGTTAATGVTLDSTTPSTKLTCTVPAGIDAGTYDVSVTNVGTDPGTLSDGFTVTSAATTVSLGYSASDTDHVPAGALTITATFSASQSDAPTISINQQGSTDITDATMTATTDGKIWTYAYTVVAATGGTYIDGAATVTIKSSAGTTINITAGSSFTIDTVSLSATVTYAQGANTTGPFKAGTVTITATLSASQANAPKISIDQQGSTDIADADMTGSGTSWTYDYTVTAKDGSSYKDGDATVNLKTSGDSSINIGSGGTFTMDTAAPTVALTYAQGPNTTGPFKAGDITVTATFSENPAATPQIAISQAGDTDIAATNMSGSARVWTYTYTVHAATESGYTDGDAAVTVSNGGDTASNDNAAATNNTFTIDTATTVTIDTVTSPTTSSSQVLTGTKETGATVTVSVTSPVTAGTVTYPSATTWSSTITNLLEQANSILVTATDTAGNTADATISITYDGIAPQISAVAYVNTTTIDVTFSEAVVGGAIRSRYSISGLTIESVADQGNNVYRLTTSTMTPGQTYTVVVSTEIVDLAGNTVNAQNNSVEYQTGVKGRVTDGDEAIDSGDAILVLRYSVGLTTLTDLQKWAGNVTGKPDNNDIDSGDAIKILRYSVGLITSFD